MAATSQSIRIRLKAFDHRLIDKSAREIVETRSVGAWALHGKTGAAYPRRADRSFDYARGWGWYAGWARREGPGARGDGALIFVRLTQARERRAGSPGVLTRDAFLAEWPKLVGD